MKTKIVFITENFFPHVGGVEKYFLDIAKELKKRGYEVRVITSNSGGKTGCFEFEGIPVYAYKWFSFADHSIPKKSDLDSHVQWADIVHTTTYTAGPVSNKVAKKYHKPCIIIVHEVLGKKWHWIEKNPFMALAYRIFEYYCVKQNYDFYLCNSHSTEQDLQRIVKKSEKIRTIYHSVELENLKNAVADRKFLNEYFNIKTDKKVFLYYGRPGLPKGVFVYLKAIKELSKKNSIPIDVVFAFLLSRQPARQRKVFIELVKKYKLEKFVLIAESVPHEKLYSLVKAADYIVVPSITEGFGLTCVESCTMGCRVIHSSGGSLPEVAFGKTLQFENRNIFSLSSVLLDVINGCQFIQSDVKEFTVKTHIDKLEQQYKSLLTLSL